MGHSFNARTTFALGKWAARKLSQQKPYNNVVASTAIPVYLETGQRGHGTLGPSVTPGLSTAARRHFRKIELVKINRAGRRRRANKQEKT